MRRHDREVSGLPDILAILNRCDILRLGLCMDNKPYIVPMNFACDLTDDKVSIYLHSAKEGRKLDIIAQNGNACFEADCSYKTLVAVDACNWSAEYESVTGEGVITVLDDESKKIHALNLLMKRYGFDGTPHYKQRELAAVAVLQISVTAITGKRNVSRPQSE